MNKIYRIGKRGTKQDLQILLSTWKIQRNLQIIRIVSVGKVAECKFNIQISTASVNSKKKQNIIFQKNHIYIKQVVQDLT